MSNPKFYIEGNKWFYENVRPSYKEAINSYSSISRVKYDIGRTYGVNLYNQSYKGSSNSYSIPKVKYDNTERNYRTSQHNLCYYSVNSYL